jgi:hypothetical protein
MLEVALRLLADLAATLALINLISNSVTSLITHLHTKDNYLLRGVTIDVFMSIFVHNLLVVGLEPAFQYRRCV